MKLHALLFSLAVSLVHAAPTLETMKTSSLEMPSTKELRFAAHVQPSAPDQGGEAPFFLNPNLQPLLRDSQPGEVVGRVALGAQLDRHRSLARLKLGARSWDVSLAGDAGFAHYYLTLRDGADLRVASLGDIGRLRNEGIDIQVEPGVTYNFHLAINIFSPVRGSTMQIRPAAGTRGPDYGIKTGALLDAVKDRALVFNADGNEYWSLYGTDVDAATSRPASTRSFLFIHMDGLSSKAWPVAEGALPEGQPVRAEFKSSLSLTRSASEVVIAKPR
jgi:hypothetical protein